MKAFVFFVAVVVAFVAFLHWREWQEGRTAESASGTRNEIARASPAASNSDPQTPERIVISEKPIANGPDARAQSTAPRAGIPEAPAPSPVAPLAGSDEDAREFIVFLDQVAPGDGALAHGGFYELNSLPPAGYRSPLEERPGDQPRDEPTRGWTRSGGIFIAGIPDGYAEGDRFHGWLVRTGARTIVTDEGKQRTVAAYRIVSKPRSASATPKPGEWMFRKNRRTLDRQER